MSAGIFLTVACLLLVGLIPVSYSDKLSDDIGISISDSCMSLIKLNSDKCPDYQMIATVFPDTTLPQLSGGFDVIDGIYQRDNQQKNKHYEFYRTNGKSNQWLDPPADTQSRIKMIEIRPSLPEYKIHNSTKMILNNDNYSFERFLGHSRYVDASCMKAAITSENWIFVLADTINYLHNNCDPNSTELNTIKKISTVKTIIDIRESRDYQHKLWIQHIKENCIFEYGKC